MNLMARADWAPNLALWEDKDTIFTNIRAITLSANPKYDPQLHGEPLLEDGETITQYYCDSDWRRVYDAFVSDTSAHNMYRCSKVKLQSIPQTHLLRDSGDSLQNEFLSSLPEIQSLTTCCTFQSSKLASERQNVSLKQLKWQISFQTVAKHFWDLPAINLLLHWWHFSHLLVKNLLYVMLIQLKLDVISHLWM